MLGNTKAAIKLTLILLWIAFSFLWLALAYKLKKYGLRDRIMSFSSAVILRIIGIRVAVTGHVTATRPLLMVSNHMSYLDVWVMNSVAHMHFTPKIEISRWPVISQICRMSGAIFVDRRPEKMVESKDAIIATLAKGDIICLFPEATTGNGLRTLPFKSGFFSLAESDVGGKELTVQPVAITYSSMRGLPLDHTQWPLVAWYGDMLLMPHLWNLLKVTPVTVEVVFLNPMTLEQHGNRKKLAVHCQHVIEEAVESIRGRHRHKKSAAASRFHPRFIRQKH